MASESVSRWQSASAMFASYGQTDLANEASHRAYMAELREKSDAAIADSRYHYADHARRARLADANAASIPEPVDEAILVGRSNLPEVVQLFADKLAIEGEVGGVYSKEFQINDKVSLRTTATLVEDDTTENLDRCVAVLIEMSHPIATANLLYQRVGNSWHPIEDTKYSESDESKRSRDNYPDTGG